MKDHVFERNGHISDLAISRFVDALRSGQMDKLPRELIAHVESCIECKKAILQLHALMPDKPGKTPDTNPGKDDANDHR